MVVIFSACTSIPTLPPVNGPSAEVEVSTSTLKGRSVFYPDEKVSLVVFRMADKTRLGGEELTIQAPKKILHLPAGTELQVRLFKSMALMGGMVSCLGEAAFNFDSEKRYRLIFNFDYNYNDPSSSTCVGAIETLDMSGLPITKTPLTILAH